MPWSTGRTASALRRQRPAQTGDGRVDGGSIGKLGAGGHAFAIEPDAEGQAVGAHVQRLARLQALIDHAGRLAIGEGLRQQQLFAIGIEQAEAETAVLVAGGGGARALGRLRFL